ncbi:homeodomain-containing protein [Tamaricihabitans halophyticus]|uniref:Homeodomain-containing protein n=1 Tax=Tamaricihabitans halophyticus TaxID=1262583 RepID=A0A4R2QX80_9PSEU|nr:homeodomain-containing protein [Tamaricihabitans halophyticus]
MARQPEVFVRELLPEEAQRLVNTARKSKNRVRMRRAGIVLASMQGRTVGEIVELFAASEGRVREVIHTFNERGFAALDPKRKGARQAKTDRATRERICRITRCGPRSLGQPFSVWSLPKLRDYLADTGVITELSVETLRKILRAGDVSWQATKTRKPSTDPDFTTKMHRILTLYDHPPGDGRVICVDEFGPLNLQPRPQLVRYRPPGPAASHLQPSRRGAAPVRRAGPGQRTGVLPHPRSQALAGVFGLPAAAAQTIPPRPALRHLRQLRPAQEGRGPRLVRHPRRRTGVHPPRTHPG